MTPENPPITPDRLLRFEAKIMLFPFVECAVWVGAVDNDGYGMFWNGARLEKAHRFAFRASGRELTPGVAVCHRCDFPACVNPDHLFIGWGWQNVADMVVKGRKAHLTGSGNPNSKTSTLQVAAIRDLYATGRWTQAKLGEIFGISQPSVGKIVRGERHR